MTRAKRAVLITGLCPDGRTDNTAAFQRAFDRLHKRKPKPNAGGSEVAIYPGGCAPPVLAKSEPDAGDSADAISFHNPGE
jgi:hypothetical protein